MSTFRLPADTHIGYAHLQVASLERALAFYTQFVGFRVVSRDGNTATLSANGALPAHLVLTERPGARPKPRRTAGLFHVAIRLPNRAALARVFRHMLEHGWPFGGASDHLVSEALYLEDPDGNGLELYCDRPRERWPQLNDQVAMTTSALDVDDLLAQADLDASPWDGIHPQTDIGHVHLQVSDLKRAESFYVDLLGLDVTQRTYPGALFVSAGGYHHHLGLNIWASRGAPPAPPDAVGLLAFSLDIPGAQVWQEVVARVEQAGVTVEQRQDDALTALVRDYDGIAVALVGERVEAKPLGQTAQGTTAL